MCSLSLMALRALKHVLQCENDHVKRENGRPILPKDPKFNQSRLVIDRHELFLLRTELLKRLRRLKEYYRCLVRIKLGNIDDK